MEIRDHWAWGPEEQYSHKYKNHKFAEHGIKVSLKDSPSYGKRTPKIAHKMASDLRDYLGKTHALGKDATCYSLDVNTMIVQVTG